ncbi:MAG: hypothetical protein QOE70_2939 [Chthoniobacter sp.]|nr:hypothetical protein [Chthoniobacter sp.]
MPDHIIEAGTHAPAKWLRKGLVLARAREGAGSRVVGDPCIVWDETNLWRQHLLVLADGRLALYYNSGFYGKEQLYMKVSAEPFLALTAQLPSWGAG